MLARVDVFVAIKMFYLRVTAPKREGEDVKLPNGTGVCPPKISCRHHLCLGLTPFQLIVTSSLPPFGKLHCSLILAAWHWLGTDIANTLIFNHPPSWCIAISRHVWVFLSCDPK